MKKHALLLSLCFLLLTGFLLQARGGFVAVYDCDAGRVVQMTDTPVSALPAADRDALRRGIPCGSAADAARRLEDFGS